MVIWHGMGDWSDSLGMNGIKRIIEENTPEGMYVHSLKIGGDGSGIDSHVSEPQSDLLLHLMMINQCNLMRDRGLEESISKLR